LGLSVKKKGTDMRKPEISIGLGLAVATLTYAIYNRAPNAADTRVSKPGDETLEAVRKQNAWMAAGTVAGVSLIAKDPTIFIIGGVSVVVLDWSTRVNNWTNPLSGRVDVNPFTIETTVPERTEPTANEYDGMRAVN
jgi:hypothetical protein